MIATAGELDPHRFLNLCEFSLERSPVVMLWKHDRIERGHSAQVVDRHGDAV
jgi:hypothetical protein